MSFISISIRSAVGEPGAIVAQALFGSWAGGRRYERVLADVKVDKSAIPSRDATTVAWYALSAIMDELVKGEKLPPT